MVFAWRVSLSLSHSLKTFSYMSHLYPTCLYWQIADVKEKFRTHIGTGVDHQRLILKRNGEMVCEMSDNTRMLGFYSVESGNEIHCIDTDPFSMSRGGGLTDVSLVEKYRMDDETYGKDCYGKERVLLCVLSVMIMSLI